MSKVILTMTDRWTDPSTKTNSAGVPYAAVTHEIQVQVETTADNLEKAGAALKDKLFKLKIAKANGGGSQAPQHVPDTW